MHWLFRSLGRVGLVGLSNPPIGLGPVVEVIIFVVAPGTTGAVHLIEVQPSEATLHGTGMSRELLLPLTFLPTAL